MLNKDEFKYIFELSSALSKFKLASTCSSYSTYLIELSDWRIDPSLDLAIQRGDAETFKHLVNKGLIVKIAHLKYALSKTNISIIILCCDFALKYCGEEEYDTLISMALWNSKTVVAMHITSVALSVDFKLNEMLNESLATTVRMNNLFFIKWLLANGLDDIIVLNEGLGRCGAYGNVGAAKLFISAGADCYNAPMIKSVHNGHDLFLKFILPYISEQDAQFDYALTICVRKRNVKMLKVIADFWQGSKQYLEQYRKIWNELDAYLNEK